MFTLRSAKTAAGGTLLPWQRPIRVALLVAATGLMVACAATAPQVDTTAEDAVRVRAQQRWQALIDGDFAKAYLYAAPSYRALHSLASFQGAKQGATIKWLKAEVAQVNCEPPKCAVKIVLESKPMTPIAFNGTLTSCLDETWVLEDGAWWMFEKL